MKQVLDGQFHLRQKSPSILQSLLLQAEAQLLILKTRGVCGQQQTGDLQISPMMVSQR